MCIISVVLLPSAQRHYWVDNLDPWATHFSGDFGIRWYGLAYLAGFLVAAWMLARSARKGKLPIKEGEVSTFILHAVMGVMIGGRLGYCLFYDARDVIHHPLEFFALWHGGMASHGGIGGLMIALWVFAHRRGMSVLPLLNVAAATGPLGIAFVRIANFINGELRGRPTDVPWAVIFPRAPPVNGVEVPRHPSQLYAAGIEGFLVFLVAQWVYATSLRPGLTTAAVCVVYGVGRFVDEFWRQPDLGQPIYWGWMSKGQMLTMPMMVFGVVLAAWQFRQGAVPKG